MTKRILIFSILLLPALGLMAQSRQVIADAAYSGLFGLRVMIEQTPAFVEDHTPESESNYRARFYFNPAGASLFDGDAFDIFTGNDLDMYRWFRLELGRVGSSLVYRLHGMNNSLEYVSTATVPVPGAYHAVELAFSTDGTINLWIDDQPSLSLDSLSNTNGRIDLVQLGAVDGMDIDSSGHLDFDNFVSNQGAYIGPLACTPRVTFLKALAGWPDDVTVSDLLPLSENLCDPEP